MLLQGRERLLQRRFLQVSPSLLLLTAASAFSQAVGRIGPFVVVPVSPIATWELASDLTRALQSRDLARGMEGLLPQHQELRFLSHSVFAQSGDSQSICS